jgi:Tol biopolymer transport system component
MKKFTTILILFLALPFTLFAQSITLDFKNTPQSLSMLSEGFISTSINERDFALAPDGKEIYYTVSTPKSTFQTIVFSKQNNDGTWSSLQIASWAGQYSDLEPAFSQDGNTLYFSSNRPVEGNEIKDFDIWKVSRKGKAWGMPENLGSIVNTDVDEFYPTITLSGNLYFTAQYKEGPGREDIYVAKYINNKFINPVALDSAVNSKFYEFNAFVSPDEQYIIFTSYGRSDDMGGGDLYISKKGEGNKWLPAINLKDLNSTRLDYCPSISPDGKALFITSERSQLPTSFYPDKASYEDIVDINNQLLNGTGNIYWVDFQKLLKKLGY